MEAVYARQNSKATAKTQLQVVLPRDPREASKVVRMSLLRWELAENPRAAGRLCGRAKHSTLTTLTTPAFSSLSPFSYLSSWGAEPVARKNAASDVRQRACVGECCGRIRRSARTLIIHSRSSLSTSSSKPGVFTRGSRVHPNCYGYEGIRP